MARLMTVPRWSNLLYRVSWALNTANQCQQVLRDELLFAFLSPQDRNVFTLECYSKSRRYVPGGDVFSTGLFSFESALLDDARVPQKGRILLGAAGGGRELVGLVARGYQVDAFEPVTPLYESARACARGTSARVWRASYADLVLRAHGRLGPLRDLEGAFDLCLMGWDSLSHLTDQEEALEILRAIRELSPAAPLIVSFVLREPASEPETRERRLRRMLRRALEAINGRPVDAGLEFHLGAGFARAFSRQELCELALGAGYEVAVFGELEYPHALLLPVARSDASV